jgi:hypothetical protein
MGISVVGWILPGYFHKSMSFDERQPCGTVLEKLVC